MRIVASADFHGRGYPDVPPCDLLLLAGDCLSGDEQFERWLAKVPASEIVGIAGNHDYLAVDNEAAVRELPWTYLRDESVVVGDLTIHGSPWSNRFGDWPFMADDNDLDRYWQQIPDDVDVLLTHGPAFGYGDLVERGVRVGSETLANRIDELRKLKLHVCGHIHEDSGAWYTRFPACASCGRPVRSDLCPPPCETDLRDGSNIYIRRLVRANASFVDLNYEPAHPVLVFDYDGERIEPLAWAP